MTGENQNASFREDQVNEPELNSGSMGIIAVYVVVLTAVFFIAVAALIPYFKWEAARTLDAQVNTVVDKDLEKLRAENQKALTGKAEGVKISIDEAMRRTVTEMSKKGN